MLEIGLRNGLSTDVDGIVTAAHVLPLFSTQHLFDAQSEFLNLSEKSISSKNFSNDIIKVISKIGSDISIGNENLFTHNTVFEIAEQQFDKVKKSKSLGQLIGN